MSRASRLPALRALLQSRLLAVSGAGRSGQSGVSSDVIRVPDRGVASSINVTSTGRDHTAKWMTKLENKSPQELSHEVPPIEVGARVVACEGGRDPALGHPVEYICLDLDVPATCKYCELRYVQRRHPHHR